MNDYDDDNWTCDDAVQIQCDHCDNVRFCVRIPDPFMEEINPDEPNEPTWWCKACYSDRREQI